MATATTKRGRALRSSCRNSPGGRFLPRQYPSRRKFVIMSPYNRSNESMSAGRELTFVVFMMHLLAAAWSMAPSEAYALCKCSGAMDKYLIPHYDVLHSMGSMRLSKTSPATSASVTCARLSTMSPSTPTRNETRLKCGKYPLGRFVFFGQD